MRATLITLAFMVAVAAHDQCVASTNETGWQAAAESNLLAALRREYPQVQQWNLTAAVSERQRDRLNDIEVTAATVMQTGARSAVRLEWTAGGRRARTTLWFVTQGLQGVLVASRYLAAGAPLQSTDASAMERDVMPLACRPLVSSDMLAGTRTKVPLHEDDVICSDDIEPRPAVSRGEAVRVKFIAGRVAVTSKAIAQADGNIGAVLKVRNPSSGLTYLAEVIGEQEVFAHE